MNILIIKKNLKKMENTAVFGSGSFEIYKVETETDNVEKVSEIAAL